MAHQGFNCIHCGSAMPHAPGADIVCGDDCREDRAKAIAEAKLDLIKRGFEEHAEAPNIWTKDYVAITIEQILSEGIDATLASHAIAAEQYKARNQA